MLPACTLTTVLSMLFIFTVSSIEKPSLVGKFPKLHALLDDRVAVYGGGKGFH